jgi:GTP-binding protein HflX
MPLVSKTPRAILVDVIPPSLDERTAKRRLLELEALTHTYGGLIVVKVVQRRAIPDYRTYLGAGKLTELIELGRQERVEVLILNNALKPGQMFNVEEAIRKAKANMHVWDRIDLILNIFSKHAKTSEAKLQIKLAALKHMGPRIFGMGHEMMQQMGGVGGRGGQGESNTEMMKRHLANQEKQVEKDLERVAASRELHRKRRDRIGLKTVSIIGYTNAGKSSLLNALTKKGAYVANALFATLDTRVGKLRLPNALESHRAEEVLLSDTIGFIQDLPPQLIQAFRSTLDETIDADLLLHVIDASDPFIHEKIVEVEEVLAAIGANALPKIYVFNRLDAAKRVPRATLSKKYKAMTPVFVSAKSGLGLAELTQRIAERLGKTAH